jgi:hypothetical protein
LDQSVQILLRKNDVRPLLVDDFRGVEMTAGDAEHPGGCWLGFELPGFGIVPRVR